MNRIEAVDFCGRILAAQISSYGSDLESYGLTTATECTSSALPIQARPPVMPPQEFCDFLITSEKHRAIHIDLQRAAGGVLPNGTYQIASMRLIESGISGTYLLQSQEGPLFVIKPLDEAPGMPNNPKGYRFSVRDHVPSESIVMREVLAAWIASYLDLPNATPETTFASIECPSFHGEAKVKFCSVQRFIPNADVLADVLLDAAERKLDLDDFAAVNVLLWLTGDTDGHFGNFLMYPKGDNWSIVKIDNGLSFPEQNGQLRNFLAYADEAEKPLPEAYRKKILDFQLEPLIDKMKQYGLEGAIEATKERIAYLKTKVSADPNCSMQDLNRKLQHHAWIKTSERIKFAI